MTRLIKIMDTNWFQALALGALFVAVAALAFGCAVSAW